MGNEDIGNKADLTSTDVINQLKKILLCLQAQGKKACKKYNEGNEWFKSRKERLYVPEDSRAEELKQLLAEKEKLMDLTGSKNADETVLNTIYPLEKEKDVGKKGSKELPKDCKKSSEPEKPPDKPSLSEYPSQTENENFEMGLFHGPYLGPFVTELRNGRVIVGCQCTKRNGMQADCERKLCRGKKACLQLPTPMCVPSGFGKLKPKEAKIFIGEVQSCPNEESSIHKEKQPQEEKKKIKLVRDYEDNPPVPYINPVCKPHTKGRYYLRPLRRNKITQTEIVEAPEKPSFVIEETCPAELKIKH